MYFLSVNLSVQRIHSWSDHIEFLEPLPSGNQGLLLFVSPNPISGYFRNEQLLFLIFFLSFFFSFSFYFQFCCFFLGFFSQMLKITSDISFAESCSVLDLGLVSKVNFAFTSFGVLLYFHLIQLILCQITDTTSRLYKAVYLKQFCFEISDLQKYTVSSSV